MKKSFAAFALLLTLACTDSPSGPTTGALITLTSAQAASLVARIEAAGAQDASIAALADTVDVVIKAGAQARQVDIATDLGDGPYWAVSLHRFGGSTTSFDVIAFNEPSNPTRFIIVAGVALGGSQPASSVSGSIGTDGTTSRTGHLFSVSGSQVSAWHVSAGTATLTAHPTTQACPAFPGPGSCVSSTMDVTFNFSGSVAEGAATGQRVASGAVTDVPGVKLSQP